MNALLLSGNSLRNKDWIHRVGDAFRPLFDKITVHDYAHWESGAPLIDLSLEQDRLAKTAADLGDFIIFAKSAGAVLATKCVHDGTLKPQKCVFAGTALGMVKDQKLDFPVWLKKIDCPVLFIHNAHDPVGSFAELKLYMEANGPKDYKLVELPGDTHDYDDLAGLNKLVKEFVFG